MRIIQSRSFERKVKKLTLSQKRQLDNAVREVIKNPFIGEKKKGDLNMIFIYKFRIDQTIYLLAYSFSTELLELIMLGPHENYYKELKNYIKK